MTDTIVIKNLKTVCIIGDYDWERKQKQKIALDLELELDLSEAIVTDQLHDGMCDYNRLAKEVLSFVEKSSFRLIETLAAQVAALCLEKFPTIESILVRLYKPAAIKAADAAIVEIYRER